MHFFIDHTQLVSQASSADGFGPSSADPTNYSGLQSDATGSAGGDNRTASGSERVRAAR